MSAVAEGLPVEWGWPCTLADEQVLDSLPSDARAAVERYIAAKPGRTRTTEVTDDYVRGWEDGAEAMRDEISSA